MNAVQEFISITPWTIVFQICNLLILFVLFKKFLFKRVMAVLDAREKELDGIYDAADKDREDAAQMKQEYTERMSNAREEADTIWRSTWYKIMREAREKYGYKGGRVPSYSDKGQYIKIHSVKMEDRIHVYCEIDPEAPMRICQPLIDADLEDQKAMQEGIEAKDLTMDIYNVGLSARASVVLRRAGIDKVGDLQGKKKTDLVKMRNMGRKGTEEVWALMQRFGIAEVEE